MALISLSKIQTVLPEFIDTRLMPSAPAHVKWLIGGGTFLILHQADSIIEQYKPMMKSVGILNDNNQLDIDLFKGFINTAFDKSGPVERYGFRFDRSDGEALAAIMRKYKDE